MVGQLFLGRYETVRLLGKGGMGTVFLARDKHEGGPVVVKIMHDHLAQTPRFREAFQRETELMACLNHANAVQLLAACAEGPPAPFLVMEYAPGITLQKLLDEHRSFSPQRLHRLLGQLCSVVQAAHDRGIIHRDLKPANIVISKPDTPHEQLKVLDFGLAEMQPPSGNGTSTSRSTAGTRPVYGIGTPGYMCPEQVRGEPVDVRADVYSLGAILYQLLTGRMPFPGQSPMEIFLAQATEAPPAFADLGLVGPVHAQVEELVLACLAVSAEDRPESALEVFEIYEAALRHRPDTEEALPEPIEADGAPGTTGTMLDPCTYVEAFDAWMPAQVAQYKLSGFAQEVGGQVMASEPGAVRIRIPQGQPSALAGLLSLFGRNTLRALSTPIDLELRMTRQDGQSQLHMEAIVRLRGGRPLPRHPLWDDRLKVILASLRSFLMVNE